MDKQRAAELLPIIQAFAEGKVIQWQLSNAYGWTSVKEKLDVSATGNFQIKPESLVLYVNVYKEHKECYDSEQKAREMASGSIIHVAIKMIEAE